MRWWPAAAAMPSMWAASVRSWAGGHAYAASASIRNLTLNEVHDAIVRNLHMQAGPEKTASDYMSSPAVGIESDRSMREADTLMMHFGLKGRACLQARDTPLHRHPGCPDGFPRHQPQAGRPACGRLHASQYQRAWPRMRLLRDIRPSSWAAGSVWCPSWTRIWWWGW